MKKNNFTKWFWICTCPLYFITLFYVVFLAGRRPRPSFGLHSEQPRFEPFRVKWYLYTHMQDVSSVYLDVIGNIIMFVPFTLFLYVVFGFRKPSVMFVFGFLLSLSIEVVQYITGVGVPDIDDVIFNSFGALLGILIIKGVSQAEITNLHKIM